MIHWEFIDSGFATGQQNMDFDLELTKKADDSLAFFRLYRWKPFCISLGANQDPNEIDLNASEKDQIDVVKRPTGGRAVLHAEEITYSIILKLKKVWLPSLIYKEINNALRKGLANYHPILSLADLEDHQPNFSEVYKSGVSTACFASSAKSELKHSGRKMIGSAQRKLGSIVLQHGSILCGTYHKKIINYLKVNDTIKEEILKTLNDKTIEIETVLRTQVDYNKLKESLKTGVLDYLNKNLT